MGRRGGNPSREQRAAGVARLLAGEYPEVVARDIGVTPSTVRGWFRDWRSRGGDWAGPLTPSEVALGFVIEEDRYTRRVKHHSDSPRLKDRDDDEIAAFLDIIQRAPQQTRDLLLEVWSKLDERSRARLSPAFDAYLQATEHADETRRLKALAFQLATQAIAELGRPDEIREAA